jgi:hypothetical protein
LHFAGGETADRFVSDPIENHRHIMIGEAQRHIIVAHNLPAPAQSRRAGVQMRLQLGR